MLIPPSEDECMFNAWNAKWAGTVESWIDCIPNRTHIAS